MRFEPESGRMYGAFPRDHWPAPQGRHPDVPRVVVASPYARIVARPEPGPAAEVKWSFVVEIKTEDALGDVRWDRAMNPVLVAATAIELLLGESPR